MQKPAETKSEGLPVGQERDVLPHEVLSEFRTWDMTWNIICFWKSPWVLVESGSLCGYFDWVPEKLRTGQWTTANTIFLACIVYTMIMIAINIPNLLALDTDHNYTNWWDPFTDVSIMNNNNPDESMDLPLIFHKLKIATFITPSNITWLYQVFGFAWTSYVAWHVYAKSPIGGNAWASFTVVSWTLLWLRHGLLALAGIVSSSLSNTLFFYAEVIRFPVLTSTTATFCVWNFMLFPAMLFFFFQNDHDMQRKIWLYFTNFRLTQLHVFNIVFAILNCSTFNPVTRSLHWMDLYLSFVFMMLYMAWYYCVMDRIGAHLYPIFSPRTYWSILVILLVIGFFVACWEYWKIRI